MIEHNLSPQTQSSLEELVSRILTDEQLVQVGGGLVSAKAAYDDLVKADAIAHGIYRRFAEANGFVLISEEGGVPAEAVEESSTKAPILVADEIDGSSILHREGPRSGPLATQCMVIEDRRMIASVVGDIWNQLIYGIDGKLYCREVRKSEKRYLSVDGEREAIKLRDATVAMHAPNAARHPFVAALFAHGVPYICHNGGSSYALRVVTPKASNRLVSVALEGIPSKELWEHIGPIMVGEFGGGYLSRLDGEDFCLDPSIRQSSVVATSRQLGREVIDALRETFRDQEISHCVGIAPVSSPGCIDPCSD